MRMSYAIISVGGKQYRVREGERLFVDRLALEDGASFTPTVLLTGGDGEPDLAPAAAVVSAKVLAQAKGPKIRIGKYKKRTGYKRHTGFRASLTQIQIESIGAGKAKASRSAAKSDAPPAKSEAPSKADTPAGVPEGYADLTVADVKAAVGGWDHEVRAAALEYERAHANRKGAIAALESAISEEGA
jgi:large subunit ribosomal protein L21